MAIFFKKNSVMDFLSTINNMIKTALNAENKEEKQEEKKFSGKSLFQSVKDYNHQMEEEKKSKKEKEESKKIEEKTGETGEKKETEELEVEIKEEVKAEEIGEELSFDKNNDESKDDNVINLEDKLNTKSNESEGIKNILELLKGAMEVTKELEKKTVEIGEEYGGKEHMVGA